MRIHPLFLVLIAAAPLAALERFEKFSENNAFRGDWLPELYAAFASMQKNFLLGRPSEAAKAAAQEIEALRQREAALPKKIFTAAEALASLKKAGFVVRKQKTVFDNRGKPLALAVTAVIVKK